MEYGLGVRRCNAVAGFVAKPKGAHERRERELQPLHLRYVYLLNMKGFNQQVYDIVAKIPVGTVVTYGDIARMLGRPRMARFVGFAMSASAEKFDLPWHRVTFADGRLWDGQWAKVQRDMLKSEGVGFIDKEHIDVEKYRWHPESMAAPMDLRDMPLKF